MGRETRAYRDKVGPHSGADRAVASLAGRQHGVVTTAQLLEAGLSRDGIARRVRSGRLHRLHRGVYAVGHRALTYKARYLAAVLACGPNALASHRTAAVLWGLQRDAARIEITAPRGRAGPPGLTVHRSRTIHPDDRAKVDGVPVTSPARTLVDLADVLTERRLADAVHRAEVLRLFHLPAVWEALARGGGRAGRHRLRRVLEIYAPRDENRLQRRFEDLCRRHGLPKPRKQVQLGAYTIDYLWPQAGVAVETDGAETHHTRRAFHADRERDRVLAARGVRVVRITWPDLEAPARLAAQLRAILTASFT